MVLPELGADLAARVRQLGVQELVTAADDETAFVELRSRYSKPGDADLYALLQAMLLSSRLLTGDRHLREAAEAEGAVVAGMLWFLDDLIRHQAVSSPHAAQALESMLAHGARLPLDQCHRRIRGWRV